MSIVDRAKAHAESLGRKEVEVPEWLDEEGNPTVIYSKPITMFEMKKWWNGINKDDITIFVDLIIGKAEDREGNKVFTLEDKRLRIAYTKMWMRYTRCQLRNLLAGWLM